MAAVMAKVLRGGRSGSSSSLIAAMCRRVPQEGVTGAPLLGSSPAAHAAGASRLMHSGHNSMLSGGNGTKLAEQKALLFGTRGALSQEHKIMRTGQFGGKRFMSDAPFGSEFDFDYLTVLASGVYVAVTVGLTLPVHFRKLSKYLKEK
ncbi:unnamed protein product [Urochloa decumbens]|uniref:Uncharacterized protein n=1 Tax=Urochloa decumbens TaxID=240449 RepID=A0ABC8WAY0_9POAL